MSVTVFQAVLIVAFGGPQGPDDVRPFLANVLRGRRVPPERVEEVAHHYDRFGGVSPITELTRRQAAGLEAGLRRRGTPLPVYVGMRNWHPFLADTLAEMSRAGVRRAVGLIAAAHRSYSGCLQYRENVAAARAELKTRGLPDVEVTYAGGWHTHPGFIEANAQNIAGAIEQLPPDVRADARIVFTAHSIPLSMAEKYPYRQQIEESARLVMAQIAGQMVGLKSRPTYESSKATNGSSKATSESSKATDGPSKSTGGASKTTDGLSKAAGGASNATSASSNATMGYAVVYQSRSGRPEDPWLGPDVCEYLRAERQKGLRAAVIAPIGFICDHIEVLYDLDVEAAETCRAIGLPMVRARAVNDHPRFVDALTDAVADTIDRYAQRRPLLLTAP